MAKDVVEVSTEIAVHGLYITPDMRFYSMYADRTELENAVQTIIHSRQPLTSSYAAYGDFLNETFHKDKFLFAGHLMTLAAFTDSQRQIDKAVDAIVEVAMNIIRKTNNIEHASYYPCIIPHELEAMRFAGPLKVTRDKFREMLMAEPWFTWTELMRGQMERSRRIILEYDIIPLIRDFATRIKRPKNEAKEKQVAAERTNEIKQAKKAIKRAFKLHERIFGVADVKSLITNHRVLVPGHHFDYRLTIDPGTLFRDTIDRNSKITPTSLFIINKQTRQKLATACLYFDDTALLDHLLNVKLCASNASAELDMIKAFHITSVSKNFFDDPVLPDLKGIHDPVTAPLTTITNIHIQSTPWLKTAQEQIMYGPLYHEAKAALIDMLHFPKRYMQMIEKCSQYGFWDYVFNVPQAISLIDGKLEPDLFN